MRDERRVRGYDAHDRSFAAIRNWTSHTATGPRDALCGDVQSLSTGTYYRAIVEFYIKQSYNMSNGSAGIKLILKGSALYRKSSGQTDYGRPAKQLVPLVGLSYAFR